MRYAVIFDACVLYPAPLRDFLLRLSITGLFSAKWTECIHDEWIRNLLEVRPELEEKLSRTRELPEDYRHLCHQRGLRPDTGDQHRFLQDGSE